MAQPTTGKSVGKPRPRANAPPPCGLAYHGEIGREATAASVRARWMIVAYHGEIGREATAVGQCVRVTDGAYHGEIGREATAGSLFLSPQGAPKERCAARSYSQNDFSTGSCAASTVTTSYFPRLHRVPHIRISLEFRAPELPVQLFDLADIDVADNVAGCRIDRDRAARALPRHALHRADQRVAVGIAVRLLQRFVDQVHPVIAAERNEIGPEMTGLLHGGDVSLVEGGIVRGGIRPGRDHAEHLIAHGVEIVVVGEIARTDDLDAGFAEPALGKLLGENIAVSL